MTTKKTPPTPAELGLGPKVRRTVKDKLETLASDPAAPSLMDEKAPKAPEIDGYECRRLDPADLIPLALKHLKSCLRDRTNLIAFKSEQNLLDYLRLRVGHFEDREVFGVIWLDGQGVLIEDVTLAEGGLIETHVCLKHVLRSALEFNAHAAIIYHNHPSGHTEPSDNDVQLTGRLGMLLGMMEIELVDHYIIGNDAKLGIASVKDYVAEQEKAKDQEQVKLHKLLASMGVEVPADARIPASLVRILRMIHNL